MRALGLAVVVLALAAPAASAGEVTSVQAPKRVKAGAAAKIVASVKDVASCRLTTKGGTTAASTAGADQVTFAFTVFRNAKPGRHTLTLRCSGAKSKTVRLTVTARKGKRGTSAKLVKGKIRVTVRRAPTPQPQPTPPCCKTFPAPTPTPVPTPPPVENAFRAVYALAADQTETPGYVAGITATIEAVNGWFATQTGGRIPRWLEGVKVVKLARPASDYESAGGLTRMHADLEAVYPLPTASQKSVVWTQTNHPDGACASARAGVAWMTEKTCNIVPVAPTTWPFNASYVTAHELVHLFGAVPDCAPNSDGSGHVTDDARDILFAGARDFNNLVLDAGRDDYFGTNGSTCLDIATSPLWTSR